MMKKLKGGKGLANMMRGISGQLPGGFGGSLPSGAGAAGLGGGLKLPGRFR
jgi:hypothetical protein